MTLQEHACADILIRGVNWIGDAVMTLPAIRALRRAHPGSRIAVLVKPWVSGLFERNPDIDEIIIYRDTDSGIAGRLKLAQAIRKRAFCRAILLQNAFDAALIAFLAGIPERIGYNRDGRRLLLTRAVPFDRVAKGLHHIAYYLNLVRQAGFPAAYELPWIPLAAVERRAACAILGKLRRPVVGINPGATFGSSKRWPPDRFAEVGSRVISELQGSVVIFGGPSETGIGEEIQRTIEQALSPGRPGLPGDIDSASPANAFLLNVAGRTDIRMLASLISACDLLVTNDSGPMHIACAVRTPVVAIFGSTSPEHTGPVGKADIVIRKPVDCAPCFERTCRKQDLRCMELISPDEVFDAVRRRSGRRKAVFFDRDGTLCKDPGYLRRMEDFEIFPEIVELAKLKEEGFALIGVTNQSGIARGLVDEAFVLQINGVFLERYGFDAFYYCPHHPDEHCPCRKPEPGLLLDARVDYTIDLTKSFVVGDKDLDMQLARGVGATGILVRTGQERFSPHADYCVENLSEAVARILLKDSTGEH